MFKAHWSWYIAAQGLDAKGQGQGLDAKGQGLDAKGQGQGYTQSRCIAPMARDYDR